jgi:hypothetical protein
MMRILFSAALVLAATTIASLGLQPAYAVDYPWCMVSNGGLRDCSYTTYQQCLLAASGLGGCEQNPRAMRR